MAFFNLNKTNTICGGGEDELNARQKMFVEEYLKDLNATQAAIRAGYSEKTAESQGSRLLRNAKVQTAIKELREQIQEDNIATIKDIEEFLSQSMLGLIDEEVIVTTGTGEGFTESVKERKQIAPRDRIRAAEILLRRLSLFENEDDRRLSKAQADKAEAEARLAEYKAQTGDEDNAHVEVVIVNEWGDDYEENIIKD